MGAKSTKDMVWKMTKGAAPTSLTVTAVTKAQPPVVTVADITGVIDGSVVRIQGSGFNELDTLAWIVNNVDVGAKTFELIGADLTASTGSLDAGNAQFDLYPVTDQERLCINAFDNATGSSTTIDVSTFCGSASLPGSVEPGSVTLSGFSAPEDLGYKEMLKAVEDGVSRYFVAIPKTAVGSPPEFYLLQAALSSKSYSFPLQGAIGFAFTGALGAEIIHLFD